MLLIIVCIHSKKKEGHRKSQINLRKLITIASSERAQAKAAEGDILPNLVHILRDYKSADSYVRDSIIEIFISLTANGTY